MKEICDIVRNALDAGLAVEIEGFGSFLRVDGRFRFEPEHPTVFLAYAVEDLPVARRLCDDLRAAGFSVWLDKDRLMPGQNWTHSIRQAIGEADAFIACLSRRSVSKRGMFQSELRHALESAQTRPLEDVFLIPVRLEPCAVPESLAAQLQYVDLFPDWERGVKRLLRSVRRAARGRMGTKFSQI